MNTDTDSSRSLPPFLDPRANAYDMYQKLPYVKDIELCPPETVRLVSGNLLKYYMFVSLPDIVTINTNPLAEFLVEQGKRAVRRYHSHLIQNQEDVIDMEEGFQPGLTATHLMPDGQEAEADNLVQEAAASAEEPFLSNPFAGVSEDDDDFSFLRG